VPSTVSVHHTHWITDPDGMQVPSNRSIRTEMNCTAACYNSTALDFDFGRWQCIKSVSTTCGGTGLPLKVSVAAQVIYTSQYASGREPRFYSTALLCGDFCGIRFTIYGSRNTPDSLTEWQWHRLHCMSDELTTGQSGPFTGYPAHV
jgi:hypothetical protein